MMDRTKLNGARVVGVVEVRTLEGDGKDTVMREVTWFLDTEGKLLAWNDPCDDNANEPRLLRGHRWVRPLP